MRNFLVVMLVLGLAFAWGCSSKEVETAAPQQPAETVVIEEEVTVEVVEEAPISPMDMYEESYASLPTNHMVAKGECLWKIAEYAQVYNDPFMWPLIYKANRDQIKDPDLIYPGQQFQLPRGGFSVEDLQQVRKSAGAPWKNLNPPSTANLPAQNSALNSATDSNPRVRQVATKAEKGYTKRSTGTSSGAFLFAIGAV